MGQLGRNRFFIRCDKRDMDFDDISRVVLDRNERVLCLDINAEQVTEQEVSKAI